MFKDPKNKNRLSIRKGATAKLIRTFDQKFRILVFTGDDGYLGKGAQGKCFLGILQNEQDQKQTFHGSDQQYDSEQIKQMLAAPSKYPIVVVKQITKNEKKPSQQQQYKKEIQNLALATQVQGGNRNIVKCYPYILTSQKYFYMVMEYCDGKSLDLLINKRLHSGKWFNFFEFLKIFKDIVTGYYPLNKVMIMHEDLKPQNIFIKGKNFKIGDFGLSFLMKSGKGFRRGGTTSYNGIQKYQIPLVNPSHKSDMYSIGVILHHLFFGFHPYYQKKELQQYQTKLVRKMAQQRQMPPQNIVITQREFFEIFVRFYNERTLKQRKPFVKKPQLKTDFYQKYKEKIQILYSEMLPEFIRKLVEKDINHRPSFTDVLLFIKENKIEQILKDYIQATKQQGQPGEGFFDEFDEETYSNIESSLNFTSLGQKVLIENESQVDKEKANVPHDLLRTLSWNKQKKLTLMKKYPQIFQLKQYIENFNKLTRMLMEIQQELSELDLKQFLHLFRMTESSAQTELNYEQKYEDNEFTFYDDKKMQVEFVVQKYLLSFLNYVLIEAQKQIKLLSEAELEIFYKQNIDLILQISQKNKAYLEEQLFLGESDYADLKKSQKDLQRIIIDQFLYNLTIDKQNLIFVYYCLTILKIKDKLNQRKKQFVQFKSELKEKNQNNKPIVEDVQTQQDIKLQKENICQFFYKNRKQIPDVLFKEFQENIISQLKKRKIFFMVNID